MMYKGIVVNTIFLFVLAVIGMIVILAITVPGVRNAFSSALDALESSIEELTSIGKGGRE